MLELSEFLGADLDKLLMSDIYGNLVSGSSFDSGVKAVMPFYKSISEGVPFIDAIHYGDINAKQQGWLFDSSKLSILYAQTHKVASDNPKSKISFDFYDDRSDILSGLLFSKTMQVCCQGI